MLTSQQFRASVKSRGFTSKPKTSRLIFFLTSFLFLSLSSQAVAQSYTFTPIDYPGAVHTAAFAINDAGQIVGQYSDSNGNRHGFIRDTAGQFTSIDFPFAWETVAWGINNIGQIVGTYMYGYSVTHSFILDNTGQFTSFDIPVAIGTHARAINDAGQIVGSYRDNNHNWHGFIRDTAGQFTSLDVPGAIDTDACAINNIGQIVGNYYSGDPLSTHGFIRDTAGQFTSIDFPWVLGVALKTYPWGINNIGQIVGTYLNQIGDLDHNFLRDSAGEFISFDNPDAQISPAYGINDSGQIVGYYWDGVTTHGFIASNTPPQPCVPPQQIYAGNDQAHGLFEGTIENISYDGINETTAKLSIQGTEIGPLGGTVQFWVKINTEYAPGYIAVGPDWDETWGGKFANWGYLPPGNQVNYKLSFCKPGNVVFELDPGFGTDNYAASLTILDAIIGTGEIIKLAETPQKLVEMLDKIGKIPLMGSAFNHVKKAFQLAKDRKKTKAINQLTSAVGDLTKLASNKTQRAKLLSILRDYGLKKGSTWLFKKVTQAPFRAFEILGDFIVYIVQTKMGSSIPRVEVIAN